MSLYSINEFTISDSLIHDNQSVMTPGNTRTSSGVSESVMRTTVHEYFLTEHHKAGLFVKPIFQTQILMLRPMVSSHSAPINIKPFCVLKVLQRNSSIFGQFCTFTSMRKKSNYTGCIRVFSCRFISEILKTTTTQQEMLLKRFPNIEIMFYKPSLRLPIPVLKITFTVQPIRAYGQETMVSGHSLPMWDDICKRHKMVMRRLQYSGTSTLRHLH